MVTACTINMNVSFGCKFQNILIALPKHLISHDEVHGKQKAMLDWSMAKQNRLLLGALQTTVKGVNARNKRELRTRSHHIVIAFDGSDTNCKQH